MLLGVHRSARSLVQNCRSVAPAARIVAMADDAAHEQRLRAAGADFVLAPHTLVAEELAFVTAAVLTDNAGVAGLALTGRRGAVQPSAETAPLKNVA